MSLPRRGQLEALLERSQERGFLGPGPVSEHIERALDLVGVTSTPPTRGVDLGTGGGIPGLVLALAWPESRWAFIESNGARAAFLGTAVAELELEAWVEVLGERAEVVGRGPHRGRADLVTARSFGIPAVTAECGSPLLRCSGLLVVAEPPGGRPMRWDDAGLALLGMQRSQSIAAPTAYQILCQVAPCPDKYPRRTGVPSKRPLF